MKYLQGDFFSSETFCVYFTFLVLCMSSEPMVMAALSFWHRIGNCVYVYSILGEMIWYLPVTYIYFNKFFFSLAKYWLCCGTFICPVVAVGPPAAFLSSVLLIPLCWSSSLPHSTSAVCLFCGGVGCRWEQSFAKLPASVSKDSFPMPRVQTRLIKPYRQELASQRHPFLLWCFLF